METVTTDKIERDADADADADADTATDTDTDRQTCVSEMVLSCSALCSRERSNASCVSLMLLSVVVIQGFKPKKSQAIRLTQVSMHGPASAFVWIGACMQYTTHLTECAGDEEPLATCGCCQCVPLSFEEYNCSAR